MSSNIVLQVEDLHTSFFTRAGEVKAVDGVSFFVREGETFGIVGESGCGKSVTGLSIITFAAGTSRPDSRRENNHGGEKPRWSLIKNI